MYLWKKSGFSEDITLSGVQILEYLLQVCCSAYMFPSWITKLFFSFYSSICSDATALKSIFLLATPILPRMYVKILTSCGTDHFFPLTFFYLTIIHPPCNSHLVTSFYNTSTSSSLWKRPRSWAQWAILHARGDFAILFTPYLVKSACSTDVTLSTVCEDTQTGIHRKDFKVLIFAPEYQIQFFHKDNLKKDYKKLCLSMLPAS